MEGQTITYSANSTWPDITLIIHQPSLLLKVELNPVVKPNHILVSAFANKNMLKTTRVHVPDITREQTNRKDMTFLTTIVLKYRKQLQFLFSLNTWWMEERIRTVKVASTWMCWCQFGHSEMFPFVENDSSCSGTASRIARILHCLRRKMKMKAQIKIRRCNVITLRN